MTEKIIELIAESLKDVKFENGYTADDITLTSDLGLDVIENVVKKFNIDDVSKSFCDVCGGDDVVEYPHVGFTCYTCSPM